MGEALVNIIFQKCIPSIFPLPGSLSSHLHFCWQGRFFDSREMSGQGHEQYGGH